MTRHRVRTASIGILATLLLVGGGVGGPTAWTSSTANAAPLAAAEVLRDAAESTVAAAAVSGVTGMFQEKRRRGIAQFVYEIDRTSTILLGNREVVQASGDRLLTFVKAEDWVHTRTKRGEPDAQDLRILRRFGLKSGSWLVSVATSDAARFGSTIPTFNPGDLALRLLPVAASVRARVDGRIQLTVRAQDFADVASTGEPQPEPDALVTVSFRLADGQVIEATYGVAGIWTEFTLTILRFSAPDARVPAAGERAPVAASQAVLGGFHARRWHGQVLHAVLAKMPAKKRLLYLKSLNGRSFTQPLEGVRVSSSLYFDTRQKNLRVTTTSGAISWVTLVHPRKSKYARGPVGPTSLRFGPVAGSSASAH